MPVIVSVVAAGVGALVMVLAAEVLMRYAVVGETEHAEEWFVDQIGRLPGVRRAVAAVDRFVWGGAMVTVGLLATLVSAAVVGWIFTTLDDHRGFAKYDEAVAAWGGDHATHTSTDVLRAITWLGDTAVLLVVLVVVGLVAVARFPRHPWSVLGFFATVVIGVSVINNGLKWMIMRDRPTVEHLVGSGGSSFPSGHSAASAACWMAIAIVVSRRMRRRHRQLASALAVSIAVLVAASRVLLGVHWLTDVIAGVIVGWTWCFLVALLFGGRIQRFGEPVERIAASRPRPSSERGDALSTIGRDGDGEGATP